MFQKLMSPMPTRRTPAVAALLLACASLSACAGGGPAPTGTTAVSAEATTASPSETTQASETAQAAPSASASPPSPRACVASEIEVAYVPKPVHSLRFTNTSESACTIAAGHPEMTLVDASGNALGETSEKINLYDRPLIAVTVEAGDSAWAYFSYIDMAYPSDETPFPAAAWRIALPGVEGVVEMPFAGPIYPCNCEVNYAGAVGPLSPDQETHEIS